MNSSNIRISEKAGDIICVLRFSWNDEMKSWRCKVEDPTYIFAVHVTSNHIGRFWMISQDVV
jgi:hypothetical protein